MTDMSNNPPPGLSETRLAYLCRLVPGLIEIVLFLHLVLDDNDEPRPEPLRERPPRGYGYRTVALRLAISCVRAQRLCARWRQMVIEDGGMLWKSKR